MILKQACEGFATGQNILLDRLHFYSRSLVSVRIFGTDLNLGCCELLLWHRLAMSLERSRSAAGLCSFQKFKNLQFMGATIDHRTPLRSEDDVERQGDGAMEARVGVLLSGVLADDMFSKADGLGCPIHKLEVRWPSCVQMPDS